MLGRPLTTMMQSVQRPMAQNIPTGFIAAGRVTMDHDTVAAQGDGNGFAFKPFHGFAVKNVN